MLEFKRCPVCGSEKRLGESLANDIKERKLAGEDFTFSLQLCQGIVKDDRKEGGYPIGTKVPTIIAMMDACSDCGCVYITRYQIGEVTKQPQKPKIVLPTDGRN